MNVENVGILSAACFMPEKTKSVETVFHEEGIDFTEEISSKIGIENIHVFDGDDQTQLAIDAANLVIEKSGISALEIDAVIDFSILPQKYVEPAWSMSNEIQGAISAKNAFTLGFSGASSSNSLVAIEFATSLIQGDSQVNTVLLVAGDSAIPKNRVLGENNPVSVLSDASSAAIIQTGTSNRHLGTKLISNGELHDVNYIKGGGVAHPTRLDLYKLMFDHEKFNSVDEMAAPKKLVAQLLTEHRLEMSDIKYCLYPNFSAEDQKNYINAFGMENDVCTANLKDHGHIQATDFLLNYEKLMSRDIQKGDRILMFSHGLGFMSGATLFEYL